MQYHFVVVWSEENGWQLDWESTITRFRGANVYAPNLGEWLMPVNDSETGDTEAVISEQLSDVLTALNEKDK